MKPPQHLSSRDNPLVQRLVRLAGDGAAYRRGGQAWIEGDHLCRAFVARGGRAAQCVMSESAWQQAEMRDLADAAGAPVAIVPDTLFARFSSVEARGRAGAMGLLVPVPAALAVRPGVASVVLDRLQDAGNVGSILRSAAALGVQQVLALSGTAALWSPKVLRAGMGAHFALHLVECPADDAESAVNALGVPLLATGSHAAQSLPAADLPQPAAWVFGHEGQGVAPWLMQRAHCVVCIPQPGGEESLNVAAAAAICLYDAMRRM